MAYFLQILRDTPVAYWRLGETSGTVAVDASGNGRDGTYSGTVPKSIAGLLTGDVDPAQSFINQIADFVEIAHDAAFNAAIISVEVWVKATSASASGGIFEKTVGGVVNTQFLLFQEGSWKWRIICAEGLSVTIDTPLVTGAVTHLVATYDGSNMRLYKDGVLVAGPTAVGAIRTGTGVSFIGKLGSGVYAFNGVIDEVAVYNYALSPTQIAKHYIEGTNPTVPLLSKRYFVFAPSRQFVYTPLKKKKQ